MAASQANMLSGLGKLTELKQRILFVVGALIVFRLGSFIPVPGVNSEAMAASVERRRRPDRHVQHVLGRRARALLAVRARRRAVHLGVDHRADVRLGDPGLAGAAQGRRVGPAQADHSTRASARSGWRLFQSFGIATMLQSREAAVVYAPGPSFVFTTVVGLTAGTMFLMWLGEQITERGVGNGISLLIFAGIVAGLPHAVVIDARHGAERRADVRARADRASRSCSG